MTMSMTEAAGSLHATLCEIERGLFHVAYNLQSGAGKHGLPPYEVGASAAEAKRRIEQRARECGYATVIWDTADATPVLRSPAGEGIRPIY